jgi:primosomal protein N' (replication factor Y)
VGVDAPFTYALAASAGPATPGTRVLVPFGPRRLTGFVVEELASPDVPEADLREVESVLDEAPSLPAGLLALARFVSDYYACPLGEVMRAMHPGGPAATVLARLTDAGRAALEAGDVRGRRQAAILDELSRTEVVAVSGLLRRQRVRHGGAVLRELQARGWVELSERLKAAPAALEVRVLRLAAGAADASRLDAAAGRSAIRRQVVEALRGMPDGLSVAQLAQGCGRPLPSVRGAALQLVAAGVVTEEARRVLRVPDAPPPDARDAARAGHLLSAGQQAALDEAVRMVDEAAFAVLLLEGVTGSGKTEVYLRALAHAVARGRTGLYLVPEIALTPLLLRAVRQRFGARSAVLHSGLSPGERHDERARIRQGEVDVVLGVRSAVFAPLPRLGLVVVDEEQEASYKQDSAPRYHGRDVAVMRGHVEGVPVLLGSATPSLESYRNALAGKYRLRRLPERVGGSTPARVEVVDMRLEWKATRQAGPLSRRLREALDATLAAGRQALILLNRRGWAECLLCRECGEVERCESCSVSLTVYLARRRLTCHYCGFERTIPEACRSCAGTFLQQLGQGTEQLETQLQRLLPGVSLARLDADVARRKGAAARVLAEFEAGKTSVLLGTQMIAKAHDFPAVTLVGVLQADRSLWLPDFRASERTFQLLTQVAGRAGRRTEPGLVVVQTYSPEHPSITAAARQDYPAFYEQEAAARRALGYPPFAHLIAVLVSGPDAAAARAQAEEAARVLREEAAGVAAVLGPAPAPLQRLQGRWRFQVIVKSPSRKRLGDALRRARQRLAVRPPVSIEIDVDAQSLL